MKKEQNVLARVYEPRRLLKAWQQVKSNAGAAGVDHMTVTEFEQRKEELSPVIRTQGYISYFEENKDRMHYDQYIEMKLPIGSGTIQSACKNVIGARMKQGGMTWSESGAAGMLQIRASPGSERFLQDFRSTFRPAA